MPLLDVSDLLTDPDFVQYGLTCKRNVQTVGEDGIAEDIPTLFNFTGVVTSAAGDALNRLAEGSRVASTITICTRFHLRAGNQVNDADVVTIPGRCCNSPLPAIQYTVTQVNDYTRYGVGFIEATCEALPLYGTVS